MRDIFFTADTHFNHDFIRKCCQRPFNTCEEMDETMIANWNRMVKPGDTIYHLGDFAFGGHDIVKNYRKRLNGKIHLIMGNHDYKNRIQNIPNLFSSISDIKEIKYNHKKIILCHYAMRTWASSHYNSYQLYGHSHGMLPPIGKQMDVGVDCNGFAPIHIDKILRIMLMKPDNPNFIQEKNRRK